MEACLAPSQKKLLIEAAHLVESSSTAQTLEGFSDGKSPATVAHLV